MFGCLIEEDIDIDPDPNNKQLLINVPAIFGQIVKKSKSQKDKHTKRQTDMNTKIQTDKRTKELLGFFL